MRNLTIGHLFFKSAYLLFFIMLFFSTSSAYAAECKYTDSGVTFTSRCSWPDANQASGFKSVLEALGKNPATLFADGTEIGLDFIHNKK